MTLVLIFYFSLLNSALAVNQTNTRITQFEVDTRIIGGQTVKRREDFPYQVCIERPFLTIKYGASTIGFSTSTQTPYLRRFHYYLSIYSYSSTLLCK